MNSPLPQLLEMTWAPRATASFSAVPRSPNPLEFASTRRMWQSGQIAETIWVSIEISLAQPASGLG